jgi:hypothetical protein
MLLTRGNYKLYRKACKFAGVEPLLADFLAGDIPTCVTREMVFLDGKQQRAMVAAAGR